MNQNNNQITQNIYDLLESNTPIVIFVGKSYGVLNPILSKQPWSCIITSSMDEDFAYNFEIADKRLSIPILSYEDMLDKAVLNQRDLNVIFLNGMNRKSGEILSFREEQLRKSNAEKMLQLIPDFLKGNFGSLFIIGYDPYAPDEIDIAVMYKVIVQMRKGSAFLFGTSEGLQQNPFFSDLQKHAQLQVFEKDLSELLIDKEAAEAFEGDDGVSYSLSPDEDSDVYVFSDIWTIWY